MKKVLLHICCGVCAAGIVERLREENYEVTGFFYNPNIHPKEEYAKRLESARKIVNHFNFPMIEGKYNKKDWFYEIKGLEKEPEGGKRCSKCFKMRLKETMEYFKEGGFDFFTTTLTISPHKNAAEINRIGRQISEFKFLERDFKKKEGFKKAIQISKELDLYRQNYCGCVFSRRTDDRKQKTEDRKQKIDGRRQKIIDC